MKLGYKRPLEEGDLYRPVYYETTERLTDELDRLVSNYDHLIILRHYIIVNQKESGIKNWKRKIQVLLEQYLESIFFAYCLLQFR